MQKHLPVDLQWCIVHVDGERVSGNPNMAYSVAMRDPFQRATSRDHKLDRIAATLARVGQ